MNRRLLTSNKKYMTPTFEEMIEALQIDMEQSEDIDVTKE